MKRLTVAMFAFVALLALTVPLVIADEYPPPTTPGGGCSGHDCR